MNRVVLDASALLALLHKEAGSELVERHLPGAALLTVNYSEVLKKTVEKGGALSAADSLIRQLQLELIPFDERLASDTAALWDKTRKLGLSLADRSCLALGRSMKRPVLTADKKWKTLGLDVEIVQIR